LKKNNNIRLKYYQTSLEKMASLSTIPTSIEVNFNKRMWDIMCNENSRFPMRARSLYPDPNDYPLTLLEYVDHHIDLANRQTAMNPLDVRIDFINALNQLRTDIISASTSSPSIPYLQSIAGWQ
jgi:hypothetical protein